MKYGLRDTVFKLTDEDFIQFVFSEKDQKVLRCVKVVCKGEVFIMKTGILNRVPLKNSFIFQNQNGDVVDKKQAKDIKDLILKLRAVNEFPLSFDNFLTRLPKILEKNLKTVKQDLTEEEKTKLKSFNYKNGVLVVEIKIARRESFRKNKNKQINQKNSEERSM